MSIGDLEVSALSEAIIALLIFSKSAAWSGSLPPRRRLELPSRGAMQPGSLGRSPAVLTAWRSWAWVAGPPAANVVMHESPASDPGPPSDPCNDETDWIA